MRKSGNYETLSGTQFFTPDPLPPKNPPLKMDTQIIALYGQAMQKLGKLKEMIKWLPNVKQFIKAYAIKEAHLSSEIEGINTTLLEIFKQPLLKSKPNKNSQLVMNYTETIYSAISMIKNDNLPISSRIIKNIHDKLMQTGEGDSSDPGHYRKLPVKVGNLTPAQATKIPELIHELEIFINTDDTIPPLIKAGLTHVQFETIHPFLDGNGRVGRLLIVLMLIESDILPEPIIYPSYYFKKRHLEYYKLLDSVRTNGDFESWIKFYLSIIIDSSIDAYTRARELQELSNSLTLTIKEKKQSTKILAAKLNAITILFDSPIINITNLSKKLEVSYNTASQILSYFVEIGILVEETAQKRGKLFKFKPYFEILEREYEL